MNIIHAVAATRWLEELKLDQNVNVA